MVQPIITITITITINITTTTTTITTTTTTITISVSLTIHHCPHSPQQLFLSRLARQLGAGSR